MSRKPSFELVYPSTPSEAPNKNQETKNQKPKTQPPNRCIFVGRIWWFARNALTLRLQTGQYIPKRPALASGQRHPPLLVAALFYRFDHAAAAIAGWPRNASVRPDGFSRSATGLRTALNHVFFSQSAQPCPSSAPAVGRIAGWSCVAVWLPQPRLPIY